MKTLEIHELSDYINEILQTLDEGATIELTNGGKVIAHVVPVRKPQQSVKRDPVWVEIDQLAAEIGKYLPEKVDAVEIIREGRRDLTPFWEKMEQLATEIGKHLPDKVDAVEIVREGRRDL